MKLLLLSFGEGAGGEDYNMKHYFKYSAGYINLDSENLYLTNSGNWQETRELEEKGNASKAANYRRISRMKGFVVTTYGAIVLALLEMVDNMTISLTGIVLFGLLAYYLLEYFKSDFGVRYKIPLKKITSIEKYDKGLIISFLNLNDSPDFEIVRKVAPTGIGVLTSLKIIKYDLGIQ